MIQSTTLETHRLRLRPLEASDAPLIQQAASAREIADTMISIPHPYPPGEAEKYVAGQQAQQEAGRGVVFVIERKEDRGFCGLLELRDIVAEFSHGEMSFWLKADAWGRGYMTEAVRAAVGFGFEQLGLNRLHAFHMLRNPASGRVLAKIGFLQEGTLRQCVRKWGKLEDVALWAILRADWAG